MIGLLVAETKSDIALTTGYNKFDDPEFLKGSRYYVGIRGGVYQDNGFGYQLGYEQANGANCQGLNLRRFFTNALFISKQPNGFHPYGVLSAGYEMSNIDEHKPNQLFLGAGVGLRKGLSKQVNGFIETRVLRKSKSDDTDIITTLGLAYALENMQLHKQKPSVMQYNVVTQPVVNSVVIQESTVAVSPVVDETPVIVDTVDAQKYYYVQMVALAKTNPDSYVTKLYLQGIDNVHVKEVNEKGRSLSLVIVGPFVDRKEASQSLKGLKRVSREAYIVKF